MTRHIPLRPPEHVMRLSRMGSFHQTPLSFMRVLLRRMRDWHWTVTRTRFDINARGEGVATYTAKGPERSYTLVAFAHDLPDEMRSDRVIATAWDATFTLFDGVPDAADIERLRANVPYQEAGRISGKELTLARANRSVRMWDHTVDALRRGEQPSQDMLDQVGYLMRTTAVYGSGKFGAADHASIRVRPEFAAPFQAEMLTVWLIRTFVADLAEHMAGPGAARLDPAVRRRLGIGNSTGLGMAPFLVSHPKLLHHWIAARESALARVRGLADAARRDRFLSLLPRARRLAETWVSAHPLQQDRLTRFRADMATLNDGADGALTGDQPWDRLWHWGEARLSEEGQEALLSLMLEAHADLVTDLAAQLSCDEEADTRIDGTQSVADMRRVLETAYADALATDWNAAEAQARCWYVSEEKLEPRLGERHEEDIASYEQPLQPSRDAARFHAMLADYPGETHLAEVLRDHPEHRHIARRAQIAARYPYSEIRDNTIAHDMLPIDMLRMKLSFFGAIRFDPRSDRWVRINMYQGAPYPGEHLDTGDDWGWPENPDEV